MARTLAKARRLFAEAKRYFGGGPTTARYRAGFKLLKSTAALGHVEAHEWLGFAYDYGLGVRPNRHRAFEHYRIAAESGNPNAEYHVGVFYHDGIAVRRDYRAAVEWLRRALKHGDLGAIHVLGQGSRFVPHCPQNPLKAFYPHSKTPIKPML